MFFDFISLLLQKYFILLSVLDCYLNFLLRQGSCWFLFISNTFNRFDMFSDWVNFQCFMLNLLFLKIRRLVFILGNLSGSVSFRFCISSGKFWFFFFLRVQFRNQFTEKLCILMNHSSLCVLKRNSHFWAVVEFIKRFSSGWMIIICGISWVFLVVIA